MKTYKHEFCMICLNENPQDREICECGGRNFVYGDHISFMDGKVMCVCGSTEFKMTFHMDFKETADSTYKCDCGNQFGTQIYR